MWFLIPVFAATVIVAVFAGLRRRRARRPHDEKREAMTLELLTEMAAAPDPCAPGEPMEIDGFTGRERIVCVRGFGLTVTIYETRKARRYGYIAYRQKEKGDPWRHESREYRPDTREGRLLASWFSPRTTAPAASEPEAPPAKKPDLPPDPPVDPFDPIPDPSSAPTAQA